MSQLQVNRINDASGGVLAPISSVMRNRIINGAMVIDQRNAGASVTPLTAPIFTLDRWKCTQTQASKYSVQQDAGAVTPPAGFTDYAGITSLSAYSVLTTDTFNFRQPIEGFNTADLGWGAAGAATVTLSFWVRSSLTGTFSGTLNNAAFDRSYPFTYTISAANTWEQKSITIAGDTTGTWNKTNDAGIVLNFSLGQGSVYTGTAGAWAAGTLLGATGATNIVSTNGATWYVTGVQLERGTQATSFEYRQYGTELSLCQRYYQQCGNGFTGSFDGSTTVTIAIMEKFNQTMRAAPTIATISGRNCQFRAVGNDFNNGAPGLANAGSTNEGLWTQVTGFTGGTANTVVYARNNSANNLFIGASAEL